MNDYYENSPIHEILGAVPSWITRWGVTVIAFSLVLFSLSAYFIRYPENVDVPVVVMGSKQGAVYGVSELNSKEIGKIELGQGVVIKLNTYPYQKYGVVEGVVSGVSDTLCLHQAAGPTYDIIIDLPQGLATSYGKKLHYFEEMDGEAEIIVGNKRLAELILESLLP